MGTFKLLDFTYMIFLAIGILVTDFLQWLWLTTEKGERDLIEETGEKKEL